MRVRFDASLLIGALSLLALYPVSTAASAADWYTGATPVADDFIVAVDSSATVSSQGSYFANVSITGAPTASLRDSGVRVRAEALVGRYNYKSTGIAMHGEQIEGSALLGYEWVARNASLAGFVGLNVRADRTPTLFNPNPDFATTAGLKVALQAYVTPTDHTMVQAYGSFSTDRSAYYARLRGGYLLFGSVYAGPELVVLGDNTFGQWRVGAHLTGLQLGPLAFGISAGYLRDRTSKDGVYSTLDMRTVF